MTSNISHARVEEAGPFSLCVFVLYRLPFLFADAGPAVPAFELHDAQASRARFFLSYRLHRPDSAVLSIRCVEGVSTVLPQQPAG